MKIQQFITCMIAIPVFAACGNQTAEETATTVAKDSLTYTMDSIGIRKGYASGDTAEASMVYPVIGNQSALADTLNQYLKQSFNGAADAKSGIDSFFAHYENFAKEMKGIGPANGWSYQAKNILLPVYKDLYTLSMFVYEYSGGAHGNYGTQLYQFTQAGNRLSWKDILLPDAEKAIQPLLQKAIAQHLEIPTTTPVAEMGLFIQNNTIPLAYSFALTEKGLRLIYNPYEIASYAVGMIDITIPYAALSNVVKKEYY